MQYGETRKTLVLDEAYSITSVKKEVVIEVATVALLPYTIYISLYIHISVFIWPMTSCVRRWGLRNLHSFDQG